MAGVQRDGQDESLVGVPTVEAGADVALPAQNGGAHPMGAVHDLHRVRVHEDRRQLCRRFREHADMSVVLAVEPWRIAKDQ
ncbi:hypothetical protein [Streptomyces turgidiscabies]|uniref:Transposase n=1 Tax=Streptomyces turgidiscabies TaxID=85558 RepID=A0ABU0RLG5_9ACTN|nr:hypothetical protein [Streptomyces turgidiscabies]MDQ0932826.1 hypothetical protein [Streptomyces turgidiscabies]